VTLSDDAENSALPSQKYNFNRKHCTNITVITVFFLQINAALSIRDFFQKHLKGVVYLTVTQMDPKGRIHIYI